MSDVPATQTSAAVLEQVVVGGDLSKLNPAERVSYYRAVCDSLGLNPLTKPFEYIKVDGRLTLYALKGASDQLRKIHHVSLDEPTITYPEGMCVVTVTGRDGDGRTDTEIGVVWLGSTKGDARANLVMKALTKAKRRLTLSLVGLGWLDETEIETIPSARAVEVDDETGEIQEPSPQEQRRNAAPIDPARRKRKPENGNGNGGKRPAEPETVRGWLLAKAQRLATQGVDVKDGERGATVAALEKLFPYATDDDVRTELRHSLLRFVFGEDSIKNLSASQVRAMNQWAQERLDTGEYIVSEFAVKEAAAIIRLLDAEAGQQEMEL